MPIHVLAAALLCASLGTYPACSPSRTEGEEARWAGERRAMVHEQIEGRGLRDGALLRAMGTVPRHRFVPEPHRAWAYADRPLPIGRGQTISQPYMVAAMAEALALKPTDRALEVGSGSGYAAAILSLLCSEVYGIELEPELHTRSLETLRQLGYRNIYLRCGDGFQGWPDRAPFQAILMSCSAEEVPRPLWDQLAVGGRLVYPKGSPWGIQQLVRVTKESGGRPREELLHSVRFVPLRRP